MSSSMTVTSVTSSSDHTTSPSHRKSSLVPVQSVSPLGHLKSTWNRFVKDFKWSMLRDCADIDNLWLCADGPRCLQAQKALHYLSKSSSKTCPFNRFWFCFSCCSVMFCKMLQLGFKFRIICLAEECGFILTEDLGNV
jgi:hypothetical protein